MIGSLTCGALDLLVAFVADEQNVVIVAGESLRFLVHLRDQGARRVDRAQVPLGSRVVDGRRHTVRREHEQRSLGNLVGFVDEDHALIFERLDDVAIVDDLLTHVDGCAVLLEGLLDGLDRAVDAGAVAARLGEEHALGAALAGGRRISRVRDTEIERNSRRHVTSLLAPRT